MKVFHLDFSTLQKSSKAVLFCTVFNFQKTTLAASSFAFAAIILTLGLSPNFLPEQTNATDDAASTAMTVGFDVQPRVSITPPPAAIQIPISQAATAQETLTTGYTDLAVTTNNSTGYTTTMSSTTSNTALTNLADFSYTVPALTGTPTSSNFPKNAWGFSTDTTNYKPLQAVGSSTTLKTASTAVTADTTRLTIGVRVDASKAAGTYASDNITISTVTNPRPVAYQITYDQDTDDTVTSMPSPNPQAGTATSASITLSSSEPARSGYTFSGWCKGTITGNGTASPSCSGTTYQKSASFPISDVAAENIATLRAIWEKEPPTMQTFTASQCAAMATNETTQLKDSRDNNTYTIVKLGSPINNCFMQQNLRLGSGSQSYTLNSTNSNLPSGTTFTLAAAQTSGSTSWSCSSDSACQTSRTYATGNTNYGNYYTWYTATANTGTYSMSSGNATGSICPKGWRLLTGGSSGEWKTLNTTYNSGSTSSDSGLLASPLNLVRAGLYDSGVGDQGSYGYYWSSTVYSGTYAYSLNFRSGYVGPANYYNKYSGSSVRCVAAS